MCKKIGPKQHKQHKPTTVTSYYVTAVFDFPRESECRFTMFPNPDSLLEYPNNHWAQSASYLVSGCHIASETFSKRFVYTFTKV